MTKHTPRSNQPKQSSMKTRLKEKAKETVFKPTVDRQLGHDKTFSMKPEKKAGLHPRSLHHQPYDFAQLIAACADLQAFVKPNDYGNLSIDFHQADAVKSLNKALLAAFYHVTDWNIPQGNLCPPIPGRVDYIHYVADLLAKDYAGTIPTGPSFALLDIGTGASGIYAFLAQATYGWQCVGTDIVQASITNAQNIVNQNPQMQGLVNFRRQANTKHILQGVLASSEVFSVCVCNPPFHASATEAATGSLRKVRQLTGKKVQKLKLNFAGENHELWCEGGEVTFVSQMIKESLSLHKSCVWFTSLVSKKEHLQMLYQVLRQVKAVQVKTIDMQQGQKKSRILAWTFMDKATRHARLQQGAKLMNISQK